MAQSGEGESPRKEAKLKQTLVVLFLLVLFIAGMMSFRLETRTTRVAGDNGSTRELHYRIGFLFHYRIPFFEDSLPEEGKGSK